MKAWIPLLGLLAAGCSDDDATPVADAAPADATPIVPDAMVPDAAPASGIDATVAYAGSATGTLIVAAFTSFPPSGGPIAFAQSSSPAFPVTLALDDLEPATLYVLAMLDVAPASPTQPGPEDLTAWSAALEVEDGERTHVDLTLTDP